jgi:hypothetical protein
MEVLGLPVSSGGVPLAAAGQFEREAVEDLVNTGLSFSQLRAQFLGARAEGRITEDRLARLMGALVEWQLALVNLDQELHDDLSPDP